MNKLDKRLRAAASYVREGAYLADIGSDHAYLPIFCVKSGKCPYAAASDINDGPYMTAKANIASVGLTDKIKCVKAPGFDGVASLPFTDAAICGMGGELIRDIIKRCERVKSPDIRLILQPMTMTAALRSYLYEAGFNIIDEMIIYDGGKYYNIICAEYDGIARSADNFLIMYGDLCVDRFESKGAYSRYISRENAKYKRIAAGKRSAGLDTSFEEEIMRRLNEIA